MGKLRLSLGCIVLCIFGAWPLHAQTVTDPWDFYWERFIEPEDLAQTPDYKINASSGWNMLLDKSSGKPLGPEGYGTYRLELTQLSPRKDGYELHFPFLSTASRIIVFNRQDPTQRVEEFTGKLGKTRQTMVPQIREVTLRFYPRSAEETWVVLVQISNFYHAGGGIRSPPQLGPGPDFSERHYKDQLGYIFSLGVILVICIYNLMIYARRREDLSSLVLASFCLVAALRTFANGNLGNLFFKPDSEWPFLFKYVLEYGTLALEPLAYAGFIHLSFRRASFSHIMPVFSVIL